MRVLYSVLECRGRLAKGLPARQYSERCKGIRSRYTHVSFGMHVLPMLSDTDIANSVHDGTLTVARGAICRLAVKY